MLRKIFLLILISIALPSFADNKDKFVPREYVVKIPPILLEENVEEEKEPLLDWNVWHANVRNQMKDKINQQSLNLIRLVDYSHYVDNNGKVSDIFVGICTADSIDSSTLSMKRYGVMYGFSYRDRKYYKFRALKEFSLRNGKAFDLSYLTSQMEVTPILPEDVPFKTELYKTAVCLKESEASAFYKFPNGSKRTKVKISCGWIDTRISGGTGSVYHPSNFNDKEIIKTIEKVTK